MITFNIIKDRILDNKLLYVSYVLFVMLSTPMSIFIFSYLMGNFLGTFTKFNHNNNSIYALQKKYILWIGGLYLLSKLSFMVRNYQETIFIPDLIYNIRTTLYDSILTKFKKEYKDINLGETLSKFIHIPNAVKSLVLSLINTYIPILFSIITILMVSVFIDYRVALLMTITLFLVSISILMNVNECIVTCIHRNKETLQTNEAIQDTLGNLFDIYITNSNEREKQSMNQMERQNHHHYRKNMLCLLKLENTLTVIQYVFFITILLFIYISYKQQTLNIGQLSSVVLLTNNFLSNIYIFASHFPSLLIDYSSLKGNDKYLEDLFNVIIDSDKENITLSLGSIQIHHLDFKYPSTNDYVLKDINMDLPYGTLNIIKGKSGSGKSTLIKLLLGFYTIEAGEILLDTFNINHYNLESIRNQIGVVSQTTRLFNRPLMSNILYGTSKTEEDAIHLIQTLNIDLFTNDLSPQTIRQTMSKYAGIGGNNISGGQKQTILLLRVLLSDKKIIILDEPSSALDNVSFQKVWNIIQRIENKTILIITHDERFPVRQFDNSFSLKDGILTSLK